MCTKPIKKVPVPQPVHAQLLVLLSDHGKDTPLIAVAKLSFVREVLLQVHPKGEAGCVSSAHSNLLYLLLRKEACREAEEYDDG